MQSWIDQLRWQRLPAFQKRGLLLLDHRDGILTEGPVKVRCGAAEAINGNLRALLKPDRSYTNLRYLPLKAQRRAVTQTELAVFRKVA